MTITISTIRARLALFIRSIRWGRVVHTVTLWVVAALLSVSFVMAGMSHRAETKAWAAAKARHAEMIGVLESADSVIEDLAYAVDESVYWPRYATVTRVIDGDTIKATLESTGQTVTVRIVGIDTPELARRGKPAQPGAVEATDWLRDRITGKRVTLTHDPLSNREDKYGRVLAYVDLDGDDIGLEMVHAKLAKRYDRFAFARWSRYGSKGDE